MAGVQYRPKSSDRRTNLRKLSVLVAQAAQEGAKLIVLPELCLSQYSFMSKAEAEAEAEVLHDRDHELSSLAVFGRLASRLGVHIAWGFVEKSPATGNLFNSQALVSPDGVFESYQKINAFSTDYLWMTPGRTNPPIRSVTIGNRTLRIGMLICRDVRDKRDSRWSDFYEAGEADVVLLSAGWGLGAFPAGAWMSFVANNRAALVVGNRYGQDIPNDFGHGGVCIIHRDQRVSCEGLVWNQDCIVYGEV